MIESSRKNQGIQAKKPASPAGLRVWCGQHPRQLLRG